MANKDISGECITIPNPSQGWGPGTFNVSGVGIKC